MIAHSDLAAQDLIDQNDIAAQIDGDMFAVCRIGAGIDPGRKAFFFQTAGFGQQIFHTAGHTVGTKQPDHCCSTCRGQLRQLDLRYAGSETAFTAAACNMDMLVNKTGSNFSSSGVENSAVTRQLADRRSHMRDYTSGQQDILTACVGRSVNVGVFYECKHSYLHDI